MAVEPNADRCAKFEVRGRSIVMVTPSGKNLTVCANVDWVAPEWIAAILAQHWNATDYCADELASVVTPNAPEATLPRWAEIIAAKDAEIERLRAQRDAVLNEIRIAESKGTFPWTTISKVRRILEGA